MTLLQLLKECKDRNIILSADADKLIVKAPEGSMEPELREALKAAKRDLLPLVTSGQDTPSPSSNETAKASSHSNASMPLSPYQLPFWASYSNDSPGRAMLTIAEAFDFETCLEPRKLQKAIDWVVSRHDMLRATFAVDASGVARQNIRDYGTTLLETRTVLLDASKGSSGTEHARSVRELLTQFLAAPYDPGQDAPLRAGLVNSQAQGSTLVLAIPHVVGDAASLGVILRDLIAFLDYQENGSPLPGSHLFQYGDYLRWLEESGRDTVASKTHLDYWQNQLKHLPPVHGLPTDFTRPTDRKKGSFDFDMFTLPFGEELRNALKGESISPFIYMHTVMRVLLYRFGGVCEIPVVTPMANRHHLPDPETTIGCFANEVALNIPLEEGASIADALDQARDHLAEALDHQGVPFTDVLETLRDQRTRDWLPVAQVFFSYLGLTEDLPVRHRFDHIQGLSYDLSFVVADCKDQVKLMIGYDRDLYRRNTIQRLGELFSRLCAVLYEKRQENPANLSLLTTEQRGTEEDEPRSLEEILGITPDEKLLFFEDETASILDHIREAAANAGTAVKSMPTNGLLEANGKTLLITTRHPSQLKNLLRSHVADTLRICIVNHLPSAGALREMARWQANGLFLLELPQKTCSPKSRIFATASFDTCRGMRSCERFITCNIDPACSCASASESVDLGKGLRALVTAPGEVRIPLPNTTTPYVWHHGRALNLDILAAQWSRALGEDNVALSLAPSPVADNGPDKLTAWFVPASRRGSLQGALTDIDARLPANWPDHRVALSAIPLIKTGGLDRHALEHFPLLAPELLDELEELHHCEQQSPLALRLETLTTAPEKIHYSQMIPKAESLSIKGRYSTLALSTVKTDDNVPDPSVTYGPPLQIDMNISFREHMENFRERELVFIDIDGNETHYTGKEFLQRARHLLGAMQQKGLKPGDRVIVYCAEEEELYALAWACLLGGICMAGLIPPVGGQNPDPIHTRLGHIHMILGEPVVITTRDEPMPLTAVNLHYFQDLLDEGKRLDGPPSYHTTEPDTLVYTAFTSGSTGAPKAVPLTASNVFSMIYAKMQTIGSIENETAFSMTALDHVASLFCNSIYSTVCGARQVYCSFQYILAAPERILDIVHKFRVSHTWAPDFTWRQLYESLKKNKDASKKWDVSCLRHIISAAENTREATFRNLEEALKPYGMPPRVLLHSWGMSETSSLLTMSDYWDEKSHEAHKGIIDAGRPMAGSAFRVADKNGVPVPEGDVGSFQVKGPSVLGGYYNNPKANAESFTKDGWFITGDLAMLRNGKVVFCGREKEQVVIKGQNIAQFDIEGFVDGIDGIEPTFSVVIGCKNEKTGEDDILVFAHTKLSTPKERAAIIRKVNATLASNFGVIPAQVLLVEQSDVPKALLGKIQRTNILKRFLKGDFREQVRETDMLLENDKTLPNWFARKGWAKEALPNACPTVIATAISRSRVLITGTARKLGETLALGLEKMGAHVLQTSSPSPEDMARYHTILYLLDKEPAQTDSSEHSTWREKSFSPLYGLMTSLTESPHKNCTMIVVSVDGQAVDKETPQGLWTGAVGGLSASFERQTGTPVRLIDLENDATEANADTIIKELALGGTAPQTAWRGDKRLVPVLYSMEVGPEGANRDWTRAFGSDGFCLCTGMTGRLGRELLPQLLLMTEGNFLVLGRKSFDEGCAFLEEQCDFIPNWRNRTFYAQSPLEDESSIQSAMESAARHFSTAHQKEIPPTGLLHLAADTSEQGFQEVADETLQEGLELRLTHLENLEHAFVKGGGTGPRMAFSSVLSFWGGADSALYAPACALAEAYAHNHRLEAPANDSWHCFMWSRWRDSSLQDDLIARLMEERGFLTIDAGRGALSLMALLHQAVNGDDGVLMAGINTKSPHISRYMRLPGHKVTPLKAITAHIPRGVRNTALRPFLRQRIGRHVPIRIHELENPEYDEKGRLLPGSQEQASVPESQTENRMSAIWRDVLQSSHVDPTASFFELGGTSVLVPRLRKEVLEAFGVDLGNVGIFDYPSVREMAKAVQSDSDDDAATKAARDSASARARKQRQARRARR